jgi:hypothetical protein
MSENNNLVLEHLRAIRAEQANQGARLQRVEQRLSAIEHHIAELMHSSAYERTELRSGSD